MSKKSCPLLYSIQECKYINPKKWCCKQYTVHSTQYTVPASSSLTDHSLRTRSKFPVSKLYSWFLKMIVLFSVYNPKRCDLKAFYPVFMQFSSFILSPFFKSYFQQQITLKISLYNLHCLVYPKDRLQYIYISFNYITIITFVICLAFDFYWYFNVLTTFLNLT